MHWIIKKLKLDHPIVVIAFIILLLTFLNRYTKQNEGFKNVDREKEHFFSNVKNYFSPSIPKDGYSQLDSSSNTNVVQNTNEVVRQLSDLPSTSVGNEADDYSKMSIEELQKKIDNLEKDVGNSDVNSGANVPIQNESNISKAPIANEKPQYIKSLEAGACKFFSSEGGNEEYPIFSGASISGANLRCNDTKTVVKAASVVASISDGKIKSVYVLDGGEGYSVAPKVSVKGNAKLAAVVNEGKVVKIDVYDGGDDYQETPEIVIEKPVADQTCYLYCKK